VSFTGDLAIYAPDMGDFHLWITADDFEVIDSQLGNLRVRRARLVGRLRSPEIAAISRVSSQPT
jgi:hypothetical protein